MIDKPNKVVFLDRLAIRTPLRALSFSHEWIEYPTTAEEQVLARLQGATVAIINRICLRDEVLSKLPALRLVAVAATGYDAVDVAACRRLGITVTNLRDWSTTAVAEHVFAMMLTLRRQLLLYRELLAAGEWQDSLSYGILREPLPIDLFGSILGIIGYGCLGERIAHLGGAFGMVPLVADHKGVPPRAGRTAFEEVLERADVLVVSCPFKPETRNLIGTAELLRMKRTAVLINCARGGIVEEHALADALREGQIGGAGIDVLTQEPPRNGNALLGFHLPNLVMTPHMAFASQHSLETLAEQLLSNIEAFVRGEAKNVVS